MAWLDAVSDASVAVTPLLAFLLPSARPRLLLASLTLLPLAPRPPGTVISSDAVLVIRVATGPLPLPFPDRRDVHRVSALLLKLHWSSLGN